MLLLGFVLTSIHCWRNDFLSRVCVHTICQSLSDSLTCSNGLNCFSSFFFVLYATFSFCSSFAGEVIYQASSTGKPIPMSTSSLLRSSLAVSGRHHQRASGMTSSSSATSSNSNNLNSDRKRDSNRDLQKSSPNADDGRDTGRPTRLTLNNGKSRSFSLNLN